MRPDDADRDLRRVFAALRTDDRRRTPSFDRLASRPARPRPTAAILWRPALAAVVAAAAVVAVALWWWSSPHVETTLGSDAAALVAWRAPTDVLLDTPGSALLAEVPALGGAGFLTSTSADRTKNGAAESPNARKEPKL